MYPRNKKIVCYCAHPDDMVQGAGGYVALLTEENDVKAVFANDGLLHAPKYTDTRKHAISACEILGITEINWLNLSNQRFDTFALIDINKRYEALGLNPDMILTNNRNDLNKDHRLIYESARVVSRPTSKTHTNLLSFQSIVWTLDEFHPQLFIDISETLEKKIEAMNAFKSEVRDWPHPRSIKSIKTRAEHTGLKSGFNYAEAYEVIQWYREPPHSPEPGKMVKKEGGIPLNIMFFPLKKGATVVDIGAHHGESTFPLAKVVGSKGLVIALEPVIENYRVLIRKITLNPSLKIVPLLTAISNKSGSTIIHLASKSTNHSLQFKKGKGGQGKLGTRIVPTTTWDNLVDTLGLESVDLAIVDCEGGETPLLEGMTKIHPKHMIIEEHQRLGTDMKQLKHLLREKGYTIVKRGRIQLYVKRRA